MKRFFILTLSLFFGVCGFVFAASNVRINEVAPSESGGADWIEFYVALGGNCSNYVLREGSTIIQGSTWSATGGATAANKTFPNSFNPKTSDYIVLHFSNKGTSDSEDDASGKGANGYWDFYTSDSGLTATDNVLTLRNSSDTPNMIDAMAFANQDGTWSTTNNTWLNNAVNELQWTGSGEAACVDSGSIAAGKSFGRDSSSTDTDDTGTAKNDWSIQPSTSPGSVNTGSGGGGGSIKAVITEIDAGQSATGAGDAVELYVLESTGNIGGCVISVSNSGTFTFPSVAVSSGDFIIAHFISGTNSTVATVNAYGNRQWDFYSSLSMVNSDNTLTLKTAGSTMVDFVSFADGNGVYDYLTDYSTAVVSNQWNPAATSASELENGSVSNKTMSTTKTLNRRSMESGGYLVPVDTTNAKSDWYGLSDRNLGTLVSSAAAAGGTGTITGKITEVAPGISGGDFIELFVTNDCKDVSGVKIYEGANLIKLFPSDMGTITKNKFIVLWASKSNNATGTRGVDRDETALDENGNGYIDLFSDETSAGLTGTDNNITLKNANDTIVDFMSFANDDTTYTGDTAAYDDAFTASQWSPEATDAAGYIAGSFSWSGSTSKSMYRLTTSGAPTDTNTKSDWAESSTSPGYGDFGGTPISTTKTLEIFQSPFSPYDGYTDKEPYKQTKIAYYLGGNSGDYQVTMRVFDVSGHPVRILIDRADGGGSSATVSWDGKDDNGNVVRTGVYIVNIEALNKTTGAAKRASKRVVVGRKM